LYSTVWESRKRTFDSILNNLEVLRREVEDEKEEQDRREGMNEGSDHEMYLGNYPWGVLTYKQNQFLYNHYFKRYDHCFINDEGNYCDEDVRDVYSTIILQQMTPESITPENDCPPCYSEKSN